MTLNETLITFVIGTVSALGAYIAIIEKRHAKEKKELREDHANERKEWKELAEQHFEKLSEISEEGHKVTREHTNILSGLKTLLENQRRNER